MTTKDIDLNRAALAALARLAAADEAATLRAACAITLAMLTLRHGGAL
jgi:hypothetical protein